MKALESDRSSSLSLEKKREQARFQFRLKSDGNALADSFFLFCSECTGRYSKGLRFLSMRAIPRRVENRHRAEKVEIFDERMERISSWRASLAGVNADSTEITDLSVCCRRFTVSVFNACGCQDEIASECKQRFNSNPSFFFSGKPSLRSSSFFSKHFVLLPLIHTRPKTDLSQIYRRQQVRLLAAL